MLDLRGSVLRPINKTSATLWLVFLLLAAVSLYKYGLETVCGMAYVWCLVQVTAVGLSSAADGVWRFRLHHFALAVLALPYVWFGRLNGWQDLPFMSAFAGLAGLVCWLASRFTFDRHRPRA